jgi:hypothetical protein
MILLRNRNISPKPGDAFRRQEQSLRHAYAHAQSVRERFPGVEQIVVHMTFVDPKSMGVYSAQMRSFGASAKAFFELGCPRTLCLEGGFSLDRTVAEMVAAGQVEAAGTLQCSGWLDSSRSQHACCLLQLGYRVEVVYDQLPVPRAQAAKRT